MLNAPSATSQACLKVILTTIPVLMTVSLWDAINDLTKKLTYEMDVIMRLEINDTQISSLDPCEDRDVCYPGTW